jgi:hypothetical protein
MSCTSKLNPPFIADNILDKLLSYAVGCRHFFKVMPGRVTVSTPVNAASGRALTVSQSTTTGIDHS